MQLHNHIFGMILPASSSTSIAPRDIVYDRGGQAEGIVFDYDLHKSNIDIYIYMIIPRNQSNLHSIHSVIIYCTINVNNLYLSSKSQTGLAVQL